MSDQISQSAVEEAHERGLNFDLKTQDPLWKHMFRKGSVRLGAKSIFDNRKAELERIANDVVRGRFAPAIHGFLCTSKGNGVARFVPVLTYEGTAVYFACARAFDEVCADKAVEGTYGGWTLGGKRRKLEEQAARELFLPADVSRGVVRLEATNNPASLHANESPANALLDDLAAESEEELEIDADVSIPPSPYNKAAWVENWQEFWKVLAATTERTDRNHTVVTFDIANFYDSIDLDLLRRSLNSVAGEKSDAIHILFELLRSWNRELRSYVPAAKGIPMDMIGDMSRVLANFYLVEFDRFFREGVEATGGKYVRWADDMMFTCESREVAEGLLYAASKKLHAMGLNINTAKVKFRSQSDFSVAWGFDVMDLLQDPEKLDAGIFVLRERWDDDRYARKETALKRCISLLEKRPDLVEHRRWASETAVRIPEISYRLGSGQMHSLMVISGEPVEAAIKLASTIMLSPFTEAKAHFLRCLERQRMNVDLRFRELYTDVRSNLKHSGHPVLELSATYSPYEGERP